MSKQLWAVIAAIAANALWGSTFLASKAVLAQCPPLTATAIRFSIALAVFAAAAAATRADLQWGVLRARLLPLLGLGAVGTTGLYALQMSALRHIASSQSAAVMLLAPVFTLAAESALKGSIKRREVLTTAAGLLGASAILLDQYRLDLSGIAFRGLALTVLASACLGLSVVQTKRLLAPAKTGPGFAVFTLTFYSLAAGVLGLLPFALIEHSGWPLAAGLGRAFWLWSLYLGVLCSVAAFLMWNWSIKHVSPTVVAVAMYLKTPVALAIGAALLRERLTGAFYGGTLLILGALFANHLLQAGEAS